MNQLTDAEVAELRKAAAERDKLAAFKKYVHDRLDAAGVPADPESPHRAEGCRIGGRLDFILGRCVERDAMWKALCRLGSIAVEVKAVNTPEFMAYLREEVLAATVAADSLVVLPKE